MKIKNKISQYRRDFTAIMICEFCNHEEENNYGYDDDNYHQNVIPGMECKKCNKSTKSEGGNIEPNQTVYPAHLQI